MGATFGDLLTKQLAQGGLGFGTIGSSVFQVPILMALVSHAQRQRLSALPPLPA